MLHRHRYEIVDAEQALYRHGWETAVLWRCRHCPKIKVQTVLGKWSKEQITSRKEDA